ncbi:MAG: aspartyl-phosphate phosphatase Spo0E family protein [Tissierellaceae bacterium]
MGNSDLNREREFEDQKNNDTHELKLEIERLREELNMAIIKRDGKKMGDEIIEMSEKLDKLIVMYSVLTWE